VARHHDVWVLTRAKHRPIIEAALPSLPEPHPRFAYFDLPAPLRFWKKGTVGIALYYYLWQALAAQRAQEMHGRVSFHLGHHATFGKFAAPSLFFRLPIPFLWGPVGGGESIPIPFLRSLAWTPYLTEQLRRLGRVLSERDPLVTRTAQRCALALATTSETATRLQRLGAEKIRIFSQVGLPRSDLAQQAPAKRPGSGPFRFISVGRLVDWKGFHLGIEAFAEAADTDSTYWIVGDGPARGRLERLAARLGLLRGKVQFLGRLLPKFFIFITDGTGSFRRKCPVEAWGSSSVCCVSSAASTPLLAKNGK